MKRNETTDAVLIEFDNGLSKLKWREAAHKWIAQIRKSSTLFKVVSTHETVLDEAIELYGSRPDKEWGLTDCISFIAMRKQNLTQALTLDHHFEQAGFTIFMAI